jgi:transcriptional regulator with XRE-family HTH domain
MDAVLSQYGGGWLSSRATGSTSPTVKKNLSAFVTCALLVGTGGHMTINYIVDRHDRGYKFSQFDSLSSPQTSDARTPAENLAYVREVLKPGVSDLANLFGVSRQAVYDWHGGTQPSPGHIARLEDLAKAADMFTAEGLTASSHMLRRAMAGGKNFFELVREGESAENAARALVLMLRREREQRRAIEVRLADRLQSAVQKTEYGGVPMLDERT